MHRIIELDGLRTIAIVLVIGCHYDAFSHALFNIPEFGWVGVDIFFVLSGYLITSNLINLRGDPHPFLTFYARRTLRIFPPYFLVIITVLGIALAVDPQKWHLIIGIFLMQAAFLDSLRDTLPVFARSLSCLAAHSVPSLYTHGTLPVSGTFPHEYLEFSTMPVWSLSVEEWFYILWAPVVLKLTARRMLAIACSVLLLSCSLRWFGFYDANWYFNFCCRVDTILVGGILAIWVNYKRRLNPQRQKIGDMIVFAISSISTILLVTLLFHIRPILGREIRESVLFAAFGITLISLTIAGMLNLILRVASSGSVVSRFLRLRPMVYIGQRSYMIYLVHTAVYFSVNRVYKLFDPGLVSFTSLWIISCISLAFSIYIAALSWRLFESPILAAKNTWTSLLLNYIRRTPAADLKSA